MQHLGVVECHHAGNGDIKTQINKFFCRCPVTGKTMDHPGRRKRAVGPQQFINLLMGLPVVDDDRQAEAFCQVKLAYEGVVLNGKRGVILHRINADFTEGDHPLLAGQAGQFIEGVVGYITGVVGMNAHRGINAGVLPGKFHRLSGAVHVDADGDHGSDSGGKGPVNDPVSIESVIDHVKMTMGIHQNGVSGKNGQRGIFFLFCHGNLSSHILFLSEAAMRLLLTSSNKLLKFLQQRGNYVCKFRHRQRRGVFFMPQSVLEAIYARRSIREFTEQDVAVSDLYEIVRAGIWAPSGLNNQPWRFVLVTDVETKTKLSETTHYSHIVLAARALIAVYLDTEAMYDEVKDHQAAGACIENMLLATEALGLGAVWLGQILKNKEKVNKILDLSSQYDLMAVLAVGHPLHRKQQSSRKGLDVFILKTF